ncbi:hypothetical protein S7711_04642 [Stachybotrys chartarum IBT 7711]|uniref:Xylanolytic transcriptional activator regulatory domain-containing protein n=1 Tax=Stachybotrys chartarum (strain CBS 109288 / IBT 7711) TaxID=1280523 RepID=A0A084AUK0_STACB|nr:hypothetical protein S7711_04642 [Stachybotrys chartarum IBT 7711]KFA52087.1 hypothetical protein S40293_02959 [Stachybotrys chartarum IBT 40293]
MTMVEPAALAGYLLSSKAGSEQAAPTHASRHSILEPDFDITAGSIMQLLSSRNIDWRESTDLYFQTIHPWLSIVHQERFASAVDGLGRNEIPQKRELALLVLCMQLVTQYSEPVSSTTTPGTSMLTLPAYLAAKRVLGVLRGTCEPCLELIQCGILLSLFEFGHGEMRRAYMTVGDAAICAELMGLRPGKNGDMERDQAVLAEQEERRAIYWGLLIVDRLLHVECKLMWLPFRVKSPSEDDLLPTINVIWDKQTQTRNTTIQRHTANVPPSIPLGIFQRLSQCAILLTRAIELDKSVPIGHAAELFSGLDVATRALIEAMVCQASRWGEYHECFSTCTCVLLLIYCRYLHTVSPNQIHPATSNVDVLKAIAGINSTVRIIADTTTDLNDHLSRRPDLLAPCCPVTPFSAYHCLRILGNFEHIIPDGDTRFHDIYSSLHFFAKRWSIAEQLFQKIEIFLVEKDTGTGFSDPDFYNRDHGEI